MNSLVPSQRRILRTAVALAFAAALAACQSPNEQQPSATEGQAIPVEDAPDSPQKAYFEPASDTHSPINHPADHKTSTETSSIANNKEPSDSGKDQAIRQWSLDAPMLVGISLQDSRTDVVKLYGAPIDSYSLPGPSSEIEILEYEGYSVGIDQGGTVHFVEVYDSQVSTGIEGLHIGDKPELAALELGEPAEQSDYLIIYEAHDATLRLDLDPQLNEIVAMKLIAEV